MKHMSRNLTAKRQMRTATWVEMGHPAPATHWWFLQNHRGTRTREDSSEGYRQTPVTYCACQEIVIWQSKARLHRQLQPRDSCQKVSYIPQDLRAGEMTLFEVVLLSGLPLLEVLTSSTLRFRSRRRSLHRRSCVPALLAGLGLQKETFHSWRGAPAGLGHVASLLFAIWNGEDGLRRSMWEVRPRLF